MRSAARAFKARMSSIVEETDVEMAGVGHTPHAELEVEVQEVKPRMCSIRKPDEPTPGRDPRARCMPCAIQELVHSLRPRPWEDAQACGW